MKFQKPQVGADTRSEQALADLESMLRDRIAFTDQIRDPASVWRDSQNGLDNGDSPARTESTR